MTLLKCPGGSDGKVSAHNAGDLGSISGWEDLLEKEMAIHSSTLAWKILWMEECNRLQSTGSQRVRHSGMKVKWALGSITTNQASGGDGIPTELFQILKDDAVKVLHSMSQQIWKTQQWPHDWKRSVFIPIPKKGNAKECSNYHTIAFISHAQNPSS